MDNIAFKYFIESLNTEVRNLEPLECPSSELLNKVVPIFMNNFLSFLRKLKRQRITPVCIFDGKMSEYKTRTNKSRHSKLRDVEDELKENIWYLESMLEDNRMLGRSSTSKLRNDEDISDDLNDKHPDKILGTLKDDIDGEDEMLNIVAKIKKLFIRTSSPRPFMGKLYEFLANKGFDVRYAEHDAESYCCMLNKSGHVFAVYSEDSDCLPMGAKVWIKKIKGRTMTIIQLDNILNEMSINYNRFIDLCIMSGCDYNTKPKPKQGRLSLGVVRSYNLLLTKSLEDILQDKGYDFEGLNYKVCRNIFRHGLYKE